MPPKYSQPEIERRWLVDQNRIPLVEGARVRRIEDTYLSHGRLRLRKVSEEHQPPIFKLGKKYARSGHEPESVVNIYLSEDEYESLRALPGRIAVKSRFSIADGALDLYEQPKHGFAVFEIEFSTPEAAAGYEPPEFVGEEITFVENYSGFSLAEETL